MGKANAKAKVGGETYFRRDRGTEEEAEGEGGGGDDPMVRGALL